MLEQLSDWIISTMNGEFRMISYDDYDDVVDDVNDLVCDLLRLCCEIGDDVGCEEITDVLLNSLPVSRKMSMRRSLLMRLPLIDVILSRHV